MIEDDLQEQDTTLESQAEGFADDSSEDDVAEAKAMGWKDPKEWKGDPPKGGFQKAKDFVERGRTVVPIVQSQLKREKEENARLRDEIDRIKRENDDKFSRLERMSKTALDKQRSQLEAKYEELKENVIETGDKAEYRRIVKEERDALKEFDESVAERADDKGKERKPADDLPASMRQTISDWVAENTWFKTDDEMNAVASRYHERLLKEKPGLTLKENLEEVRAYVAKRYPEKFGKDDDGEDDDERPSRSRVEGGSRLAGAGGKTAWSKLPKEAQAQADRFIKEEGLYIGPTFGGSKDETIENSLQKARERYAAFYLENEK
jgi:hypothetical protein